VSKYDIHWTRSWIFFFENWKCIFLFQVISHKPFLSYTSFLSHTFSSKQTWPSTTEPRRSIGITSLRGIDRTGAATALLLLLLIFLIGGDFPISYLPVRIGKDTVATRPYHFLRLPKDADARSTIKIFGSLVPPCTRRPIRRPVLCYSLVLRNSR